MSGTAPPRGVAGRESPRSALSARLLVALPLLLTIVAEAAWISVVAGLVQEYTLHHPSLGIGPLAVFVAIGVVSARIGGARLGQHWPLAAVALCVAGGAIGWLTAPEALVAAQDGDVTGALAANPAGWLAGLAISRGFAHARLPLSEPTLGHMLGAGVPGLALAAVLGGMVAEPYRSRFLAEAIVAAIVFVTSATLGLALTRLAAVGADSGFDWRRNPTWVGLLLVLVVATAGLALIASSVVAPLIAFAIGASIGPILLIGLVIGFDRRTLRILAFAVVGAVAFAGLMRLVGGREPPTVSLGGAAGTAEPTTAPAEAVAVWGGVLLVIAVVTIILLARLWMRRIPVAEDDVPETRSIDRGEVPRGRRRRGLRRRSEPTDAVTAYLALMDDLAGRPGTRREPAETPAEHARRLRGAGGGGLGLDLLAADYALARFGAVPLSPIEDRRAVARWRALRRLLGGSQRRGPGGRGQAQNSA